LGTSIKIYRENSSLVKKKSATLYEDVTNFTVTPCWILH